MEFNEASIKSSKLENWFTAVSNWLQFLNKAVLTDALIFSKAFLSMRQSHKKVVFVVNLAENTQHEHL